MRKTKIVCTMGPSTDKPGILRQLMENGMNVARFNFSHGDYEEHKGRYDKVRALSKELGRMRQEGLLGKDDRGAEQRRTAEKQHQTQQNEQRFSDGLTPRRSA